jgi:hypothetical protein
MAETAVAPSMSDSIRAAMKEVAEKEPIENTPEPVEEAPAAEPAESAEAAESTAAERARDKAGRFAATETAADKHRETLTLKGKPDAAKEQERAEAAAKTVNPGQSGLGKQGAEGNIPQQPGANRAGDQSAPAGPPQHWTGTAKIDWNKIPGALRESIAKDYEAIAPMRDLAPVLQQYAPLIQQRYGGNLSQGMGSVLQLYQNAVNDPIAFARDFCQQWRIDPQKLGGSPVQANGQEQQADDPYGQRFQQIETALQQIAQQPVLHQQRQIQSDIQSFQTAMKPDGSVEHPYFNDVRAHMAALMQTPGGPTNLKEAYDQACWANPGVRTAMLKEQQASQEAERRQAIARAQGAAVSVSGAPGVNGAQPLAAQSVSDTLRAAMRAAKGGRA